MFAFALGCGGVWTRGWVSEVEEPAVSASSVLRSLVRGSGKCLVASGTIRSNMSGPSISGCIERRSVRGITRNVCVLSGI